MVISNHSTGPEMFVGKQEIRTLLCQILELNIQTHSH
jgi:hypothetical protein